MKLLYLFILTFILATYSQDCQNPLLSIYGITGLSSPQPGTGLPYCSNLQNGQTCCNSDTVSQFQTNLNALTTLLLNSTGTRDEYLNELQSNFAQLYNAAILVLNSLSSTIEQLSSVNSNIGDEISQQSAALVEIQTSLNTISNNFNASLTSYQQIRANCFLTLLEIQGSAWCLACDPNYASQGVQQDGSIQFSNFLCIQISQACYPYLNSASQQNGLYQAKIAYQRLTDINNYLYQYQNGGNIPQQSLGWSSYYSSNYTEETVTAPDNCTDDNNCIWQCQNLFPRGSLNLSLAANGAGILGGGNVIFGPIGLDTYTTEQENPESNTVTITYTNLTTMTTVVTIEKIIENTTIITPQSIINNVTTTTKGNVDSTTTQDITNETTITASEINSNNENATPVVLPSDSSNNNGDSTVVSPDGTTNVVPLTNGWIPNLSQTGMSCSVLLDPAHITLVNTYISNYFAGVVTVNENAPSSDVGQIANETSGDNSANTNTNSNNNSATGVGGDVTSSSGSSSTTNSPVIINIYNNPTTTVNTSSGVVNNNADNTANSNNNTATTDNTNDNTATNTNSNDNANTNNNTNDIFNSNDNINTNDNANSNNNANNNTNSNMNENANNNTFTEINTESGTNNNQGFSNPCDDNLKGFRNLTAADNVPFIQQVIAAGVQDVISDRPNLPQQIYNVTYVNVAMFLAEYPLNFYYFEVSVISSDGKTRFNIYMKLKLGANDTNPWNTKWQCYKYRSPNM